MMQAALKKAKMAEEYMPFGRIRRDALIQARKTLQQIGYGFLHAFSVGWHFSTAFLCSPKNFGGAYSRRLVRQSVRPIRVRPITLLFEVGFRNYFTEMTTMLR